MTPASPRKKGRQSSEESRASRMVGRRYLDPGDRLSGRRDPAERVTVRQRWGPGGGPRNVLIERADGTRAVVPFPRRLRRDPCPWSVGDRVLWPHREGWGRGRHTVRSAGTVTAIDEHPGIPGVRVQFDELVHGLMDCYATYQELEKVPGRGRAGRDARARPGTRG